VKREITLKVGDDEITLVVSRTGNRIVIERDGQTYEVEVVSDSPVDSAIGSADSIRVSPAARPQGAAPAPALAVVSPIGSGVAGRSAGSGSTTDAVRSAPAGSVQIVAQMAGVVREVLKKPGDQVREGEKVVVLEAMKMEIEVFSPADGTVTEVRVSEGQNVAGGEPLVLLDSASGAG